MAKSSVLIELTSNPTDGEIFNILSDNTSNIEIRFKDDVVNINDVEISFNNRFTTENLKNVLDNVYNSLGEYTITLETQTSIKLESTIDNTVFTKDESGFSSGSLTITNEVVIIPITIESWTFPIEQPDSPDGCTKCNILIRTNLNVSEYTIDGGSPITGSDSTEQYIILDRESEFDIEVFNTDQPEDVSASVSVKTLLKLSNLYKYVTWSSVYFPSGATLTIHLDENPPYPYFLDYGEMKYQLGVGNPWQESNVFTGLSTGLQPSLGFIEISEGATICLQEDQIDNINISETSSVTDVTEPYFEVSESNAITYYYDEVVDNLDVYKTEFNSRACQEDVQIAEGINQIFRSSDIVRTQFWSNYEDIEVYALRSDGVKVYFPINLEVQNIGLEDERDAIFYKYSETQIGIYFTEGNTYDYGTATINGTYELNGFLPDWGVVGNYCIIDNLGGWLQISNIVFDIDKGADVLLFDYIYPTSGEIDTKVSSIYNREIYNVYSFDTTMINIKDNVSNIKIVNTDSRDNWNDLTVTSENIVSTLDLNDTVEFIYFNYENTSDMYYYGLDFYNILRLEYELFSSGADSEKVVEKTDNTAITQSTRNYHIKTLSLKSIPTKFMRKLTQAFSHKEIFINRIQYTVDEVDVNEVIGGTNTYSIDVKLISAESRYDPLQDRSYVGNIKIFHTLAEVFALEDGDGNLIEDGNENILITG